MSDLDRLIDKINFARQQNFISQEEAQDLKKLVRSLANNKGALSAEDKQKFNKRLDASLNKKGAEAKKETNLKPPEKQKEKEPTKTGKTPEKEPTKEGGNDWNKFIKGYNSLSEKNDKDVIRKIFGGNPESNLAFWKTISENKKKALLNSVKDGKISGAEKTQLEKLFKTTGGGGGNNGGGNNGGGGGGGNGGGGGGGGTGDGEPDGTGDGEPDGTGDGEPGGDGEPEPEGPPIVKGGNKKIQIPKRAENRANYTVPKNSKERISMPDIDKAIYKQIQKITKSLIASTKEFIEGGINYDGIDFIAENEIYTEDGQSYFEFTDFNAPGNLNSGLANERLKDIADAINEVLDQGRRDSQRYDYAKFIDLFELRYNDSGNPYYKFSVELVGEISDDITVSLVEEENE